MSRVCAVRPDADSILICFVSCQSLSDADRRQSTTATRDTQNNKLTQHTGSVRPTARLDSLSPLSPPSSQSDVVSTDPDGRHSGGHTSRQYRRTHRR